MKPYPRYFRDTKCEKTIIVKFATPNFGRVIEGPSCIVGNVVHLSHYDERWVEIMYAEITHEPSSEIKTHPFLNPDNPHYAMIGGVEAIKEMEKMFTRDELMAWAKITAMKYRLRIGAKDEAEQEVKKIKEYEAYYKYLEEQK